MEFSGSTAMKLTAKNGSKEVMTYTRESIPAEVLEGSVVRSVVDTDMMPIL